VEPGCIQTPIWEKSTKQSHQIFEELPQDMKALYEKDIEVVLKEIETAAASAIPVNRVVRAVTHALSARRPKLRYPVGVRILTTVLPFIPQRLLDRIFRWKLGLKK
ncbi:MAG: short-chain dehydrogenase/reductase, partial [Planctomycetia bacterium]